MVRHTNHNQTSRNLTGGHHYNNQDILPLKMAGSLQSLFKTNWHVYPGRRLLEVVVNIYNSTTLLLEQQQPVSPPAAEGSFADL